MREAIAKAKERFQERCTGCKVENEINERAAALKRIGVKANHTCHGDLAAVRDVALVILDGCGHGSPYGHEAKYACKVCEVYSKLNRLLPEGSGNPP